jgi:hypothetical protein
MIGRRSKFTGSLLVAFFFVRLVAQTTLTFSYTGLPQTFTVPTCVSELTVDLRGAQGGLALDKSPSNAVGGLGGRAEGVLSVLPGQLLYFFVGERGSSGGAGGYNGGGQAGPGVAGGSCFGGYAGGGGGASDIRTGGNALSNRVIVAGGGGGAGRDYCNGGCQPCGCGGEGGCGGGLSGQAGFFSMCAGSATYYVGYSMNGGAAGTQTAGGAGGPADTFGVSSSSLGMAGTSGSIGVGGVGAHGHFDVGGGGGGGGYFGGGGGGGARYGSGTGGGGGGGGSSYISGVTNGSTTLCYNAGHGLIIISYNPATISLLPQASPATICVGGTATLTSNAMASYSWSTGSFASSAVVAPVATTIYTLTAANIYSCITTETVAVQVVSAAPSVTATASQPSVCAGNMFVLNATGATSYSWSSGVLNGIGFIPASTGTYTVTGANVCGTNSAALSVSVVPLPLLVASVNTSTVCAGNSVTFSAAGANSYSWSGGVISGLAYMPAASANYTLVGASISGCTASAVASVTVIPFTGPTVSASPMSATICLGSTVAFSASGVSTYSWNTGSNVSSITVNPIVSANYIVSGTNSSGCISTATTNVVVNTQPTVNLAANPAMVCSGQSVTISGTGASNYSVSGGVVNGQPFVPSSTGAYSITGTNACGSSGAMVTVTVNSLPVVGLIISSSTVCSGYSVQLSGTGANSYTWSGGVNDGISFQPASSTSYTVTGTSALGCTASANTSITVYNSPTVAPVAIPNTICAGASATLTASGASNYTWLPVNSNVPVITVTPLANTTYTVIQSTANCSETMTVTLSVLSLPVITTSSPSSSICAGQTTQLIASGGINYSWQPGAIYGATINVSPSITNVYTVTGFDGSCYGISTLALIVYPNPVLGFFSSTPSVCAGQSASLMATGALAYTWIPNISSGSFVVVSPSVSTSYQVIGSSAENCISALTLSIIVYQNPPVSILYGQPALCAGSQMVLSGSGAITYSWSTGSTNSVITVAPLSPAIYSLTGFSTAGCAATQSVLIDVYTPVLAVSAPSAVCDGKSAVLIASGASTYTWNGNYYFSAITVTPLAYTVYQVTSTTFTNNLACQAAMSVAVNVLQNPTVSAFASPAVICKNELVVISATGGSTYTWSPAASGATRQVSPAFTTIYTVAATDHQGCSSTATVKVMVNSCTVLADAGALRDGVRVHPNPSTGDIYVYSEKPVKLILINGLGQVIREIEVSEHTMPVTLSSLAEGVYYLCSAGIGNSSAVKLILNR